LSSIFIEIVDVTVQKVGTYQKMTVTHRHTVGGSLKVDAKAIMDFATPPEVWKTLQNAQKGDQFVIRREKDAKEGKYWNWVGIEHDTGSGTAEPVAPDSPAPAPANARKNFAAVDADKQRLIVRQNALTNAVKYHEAEMPEEEAVLATATKFAEWVLETEQE
jgi:hypothetical protein